MSDKIYDVPADWSKRAFVDDANTRRCTRARSRTRTDSGPSRPSASTGSSPSPRSRTPPSARTMSRSNGSRTARSTSPTTASTGISQSAATRPRSSGKATTRKHDKKITYKRAARRRSAASPTCCKARGVKKGDRVTIYLPMIPEAAVRDARLRAHRRDPFGGVRRLLAGFARRPHRGLRVERRHHRRRRRARRHARFRSRPTPTPPSTRPAASTPSSSCATPARKVDDECRAATSITTTSPRR